MAEENQTASELDLEKELAYWLLVSEQGHAAFGRRKLVPAELKFKEAVAIAEKFCSEPGYENDEELQAKYSRSLNNLGAVYHAQGKFGLAEGAYQKALDLKVQLFGEEHFETAPCLQNLAAVHSARKQYDKAEPLYLKAISIKEKAYGETSEDLLTPLKNLLMLLQKMERATEAEKLEARIRAIEPPPANPGDIWQSVQLIKKET
ncbi:MAG: tetratricopeptide repeat protein [Candidatus Melainabacteria bacterium]|nr:tetratricopeptide repeat protein [Candidatus Melainabacteria bacterium]